MVLRSSTKSSSSIPASASVITCATLLTLSRLILTAPPCTCAPVRSSLCGTFPGNWPGLLHFGGIRFQNHAHFVIDAILKREFFQDRGMHLLVDRGLGLGLDELASNQFFRDFAGQIAHIFFGKKHD